MDVSTWSPHAICNLILLTLPFLLYLQIADAYSRRDLIVQKATKSKLVLEVSRNTSCSGGTSWSCYKEFSEVPGNMSCQFHDKSFLNSTHSFDGLEPQTQYVFKIQNGSHKACELKTSTCPHRPPGVKNLHAQLVTPERLDVGWSPPQESCESELQYRVLLRTEDAEHPGGWKELKDGKWDPQRQCSTQICKSFRDKLQQGKRHIVQVEAARVGGDPDEVTPEQVVVNVDGHWKTSDHNVAWLEGMWTGLGAAVVLSIATILAICFYDRRSRQSEADMAEEVRHDANASCEIPEATVDTLGLEYDPIILGENVPEPTTPIATCPILITAVGV